jgi:hypothetical protein
MGRNWQVLGNQQGSVIVVVIMILVLLTMVGVSSINTSSTEVMIATNEQLHRIAFFEADGGTEAGIRLLDMGLEDREWEDGDVIGDVKVERGNFYLNDSSDTPDPVASDANRDAFLPQGATANQAHTNIKVRGNPQLAAGTAIELAAGYEGKGKGIAGGGAWMIYDVYAQHSGIRQNQAVVHLQWRYIP